MIPKDVDSSWISFIDNENNLELLKQIRSKLGESFFPREEEILRFLTVNLDNIKCVLLGMDPYKQFYLHNGEIVPIATGRSFEVRNLTSWNDKANKSLINILKKIYYIYTSDNASIENIRKKINDGEFEILSPNELFNNLEKQGVLFLNSSLTVFPNVSGSHIELWKPFMDKVIEYINSYGENEWLLLGKNAQDRALPFINQNNAILSSHPVKNSFIKEKNLELVKKIKWNGIN